MKGIVITTDNKVFCKDFAEPYAQSISDTVGGWRKRVHPRRLESPLVMIVDDEGRLKEKPVNTFASFLYGTDIHGTPIVGDVVIVKEELKGVYVHYAGMTESEVDSIRLSIMKFNSFWMKGVQMEWVGDEQWIEK